MAFQQIEIPVRGMDCAGCCNSVQKALTALPGVQQANVLLAAEKAIVQYDASVVDISTLQRAVEGAGYTVPVSSNIALSDLAFDDLGLGSTEAESNKAESNNVETNSPQVRAAKVAAQGNAFTRSVLLVTGFVAGLILLVVVGGERLGLIDRITERIPWTVGWVIVLLGWYPILRHVVRSALRREVRSALRREVISHTLMSLGVVAALAVGQWTTAAIVVCFAT